MVALLLFQLIIDALGSPLTRGHPGHADKKLSWRRGRESNPRPPQLIFFPFLMLYAA